MIPVSLPRDSMMVCRYPQVYRQVWVPANTIIALGPQTYREQPLTSIPLHHANGIALSAREDEICAARVLLDLSPKEQQNSRSIAPTSQHQVSPPSHTHFGFFRKTNHFVEPIRSAASVQSGYMIHQWQNININNVSQESSLDSSASHISEPCSSDEESSTSNESSSPQPLAGSNALSPDGCEWHQGSISLSLAEDMDVLSRLHCFMRRFCVEAFSASPEDVCLPRYGKSHGVKVTAGQVGIRCLFCKHRKPGNRPERAVCFPSSLRNIYHSIETWQRRHSVVCEDIPEWVRQCLRELMESSKSRAGGRRQYWEDSAQLLGLVDTSQGVRFSRTPGDLRKQKATFPTTPMFPSRPIVHPDDREYVTEYLYLLMDQMETCRFTEEDRSGGRSKIKDNEVGLPGMQCKHCQGKAGFGRYFPTKTSALALANSDRNIFNHLQKCRRCPLDVKSRLLQLSTNQTQPKNRRGLRKLFFQRVWSRIHDEAN